MSQLGKWNRKQSMQPSLCAAGPMVDKGSLQAVSSLSCPAWKQSCGSLLEEAKHTKLSQSAAWKRAMAALGRPLGA